MAIKAKDIRRGERALRKAAYCGRRGNAAGMRKHTGRMGALVTPRGNVGTGFSDAQRAGRIGEIAHAAL